MQQLPVALTIAGSDSGGGAGVQADILTFAACGAFATSAITCLTAQNPDGVSGVHACPGAFVREQAERVAEFFPVGAVKSGMLLNADIIGAVSEFLNAHPDIPYILDPVMVATSGARLLDAAAVAALVQKLVPRAALVTPNLDEAEVFLGRRPSGLSLTQKDDALALAKKLGVPVLLKGGHASSSDLLDVYATPAGETLVLTATRRADIDTHGSGCTLAAAITAFVARGLPIRDAVTSAHAYLQNGIAGALAVDGKNYIAHFSGKNAGGVETVVSKKQETPARSSPAAPVPAKKISPLGAIVRNALERNPTTRPGAHRPTNSTTTPPALPGFKEPPIPQDPDWAGWLKLNLKIAAGAIFLHFFIFDRCGGLLVLAVVGHAIYSYKRMEQSE